MLGARIPTSIFFFVVLFISLIFRVTNLHLIEFKGDEALNLYLAAQPLFGNPMPYGGTVSSIGTLNPPIFNYLLFPFTLLSLDPKIIVLLIGILNSLAIAFLFLLVKRFYNLNIALIFAFLFALSPWAIIYSRKIWPQDFIVPLLVPIIFSIHKVVKENDTRFWIPYTVFSMFLIQLHQSGLFFVPFLTLFMLISKVKINLKAIFVGFIIGILPFIPYIFFQISSNCPDCATYIAAKENISGRSPLNFFRPFQITSQGDFHFLLYDDMADFAKNFPLAFNLRKIFYLEYLLLPLGLLVFWRENKKFRSIVYTTLALPIAYFLLSVVPHMHYAIIIQPFLFLFLACAFYYLINNKNKLLKFTATTALLSILITSFIFNFSFFSLVEQKKHIRGDYGTSFVVTEQRAKDLLAGYEKDTNHDEMLLASYLPKDQLYGTKPIGKMLYSFEKTSKRLHILEERLKEVPVDPRVQNELIAYYSFSNPTEETIELLEEKGVKIEGYKIVLEMIRRLYVEQSRPQL